MSSNTSTVTITSAVMPDVTFTIRRISYGLRGRIRRRLIKALSMIREKTDEIEHLAEEHGIDETVDKVSKGVAADNGIVELELDGDGTAQPRKTVTGFTALQLRVIEKIEDVSREIDIITQTESDPVYLEECLVSINGYEVDGKVPDWKLLLEAGDEALCAEIIHAIKAEAGLTVKEKENLESPITSGAVADGQMNVTTAPNASATVGGDGAIVGSTSQST